MTYFFTTIQLVRRYLLMKDGFPTMGKRKFKMCCPTGCATIDVYHGTQKRKKTGFSLFFVFYKAHTTIVYAGFGPFF